MIAEIMGHVGDGVFIVLLAVAALIGLWFLARWTNKNASWLFPF